MDVTPRLPEELSRQILSLAGPDQEWSRLGGQSGRRIFSVTGSRGSCVLKLDPHEIEHRFYTRWAAPVGESGFGVPRLLGHSEDAAYLLLERVDTDLEPEPKRLVNELHELHTKVPVPPDEALFQPEWPASLTDTALERLEVNDPAISQRAWELQNTALDTGLPEGVISGDPNPGNWGRRGDQLVLFDWERFGVGQPELDIAIAMRGLPGRDEFETVAGHYSALSGRESPEGTYHRLVAWKLWTILEFVTEPRIPDREKTMQWLRNAFDQWIGSV